MPYCPLCNKLLRPIWPEPMRLAPDYYCICPCNATLTISITATDHTVTQLRELAWALREPEHTPIPKGIYDAFRDEELAL